MRLGVSPTATSTPKGFLISGLRLYFPALEPWDCAVCFAPPLFFLVYLRMLDHRVHQPPPRGVCQLLFAGQLKPCLPRSTVYHLAVSVSHGLARPGPPAMALLRVLSAQLRVSAPPTGLDECFFNSLVGLPYSSIFCQFWLFFVLKLLLSFWLCEDAQCVYLRLLLGRKSKDKILKAVREKPMKEFP